MIEIQQFLVDLLHCNKQEVTYCDESTMWRKDCTGLTLFAKKICNKMNWNVLGGWFYKTKHAKTCFKKKEETFARFAQTIDVDKLVYQQRTHIG